MKEKTYIHFDEDGNSISVNSNPEQMGKYISEVTEDMLDSNGDLQCYTYDKKAKKVIVLTQQDVDKQNTYDIFVRQISQQTQTEILDKYSIIDQINFLHDKTESKEYKTFLAFRDKKIAEANKLKQEKYNEIFGS